VTDYCRPLHLEDALALLADGSRTVLAGGTDLYPAAGAGLGTPVLDISGLAGMREIAAGEGLRIGGGVTWSEIAAAKLPDAFAGLQQAAVQIGGRQIQNVGTVAGNICNASPAADGVPPLLTLDAQVELASASGRRRVPLADFVLGPRRTARATDELVLALHVPAPAVAGKGVFLKLGARAHLVISIVSVAVRCVTIGGIVTEITVAVGACSPVPCRVPAVEAALTGAAVAGLAARVRPEDLAASLSPIGDIRAPADYRLSAVTELVRRAVERAAS
jgi:CO/xanthine dehydrogenase FAD-binding subunit